MKPLLAVNLGEEFWIKPNQGIDQATHLNSLGGLFSLLLPNAYILAGLILLFFLIFGGLTVILGAGKNSSEQVEKGKKILTSTALGFLVVFASYWLIQIIEIVTGIPIL